MPRSPRPDAVQRDGLSRRASLTFVSGILRQGARTISGLIVTPILVGGLGPAKYGVWIIIRQVTAYVGLSDLRAMTTLKFTLAVTQHDDDVEAKRRQIGAALVLWLATSPIAVVATVLLILSASRLLHVGGEALSEAKIALAVMAAAAFLERLAATPANVLRGMNLDFKSMGIDAFTILGVGLLSVVAIALDLGLVGLAVGTIVGLAVSGSVRLWVARRALPWLGWSRPRKGDVRAFFGVSRWLLAGHVATMILENIDIMLIGLIMEPRLAAVYALTEAATRIASGPIAELLGSGGPGIALLVSRKEWTRLREVRNLMYVAAFGLMTVVGAGVVLLNESFIALWVGSDLFADATTNLLFVVIAIVSIVSAVDSVIVDSMLEFKAHALVRLSASVIAVAGGVVLTDRLGLRGMAIAILVAKLSILATVPRIIRTRAAVRLDARIIRPLVVSVALIAVTALGSDSISAGSWTVFFPVAALTATVTALAWWTLALDAEHRTILLARLRTLRREAP